jgi:hypothetical protein
MRIEQRCKEEILTDEPLLARFPVGIIFRGDAAENARFEDGLVGDGDVEWDLERRGLLQVAEDDMVVG